MVLFFEPVFFKMRFLLYHGLFFNPEVGHVNRVIQKLNTTQTLSSSLKTMKRSKPVVKNYFKREQITNAL